ncbi:hypothetical protein MARPO_0021s0026, partial [Marchantia polymorpha]
RSLGFLRSLSFLCTCLRSVTYSQPSLGDTGTHTTSFVVDEYLGLLSIWSSEDRSDLPALSSYISATFLTAPTSITFPLLCATPPPPPPRRLLARFPRSAPTPIPTSTSNTLQIFSSLHQPPTTTSATIHLLLPSPPLPCPAPPRPLPDFRPSCTFTLSSSPALQELLLGRGPRPSTTTTTPTHASSRSIIQTEATRPRVGDRTGCG